MTKSAATTASSHYIHDQLKLKSTRPSSFSISSLVVDELDDDALSSCSASFSSAGLRSVRSANHADLLGGPCKSHSGSLGGGDGGGGSVVCGGGGGDYFLKNSHGSSGSFEQYYYQDRQQGYHHHQGGGGGRNASTNPQVAPQAYNSYNNNYCFKQDLENDSSVDCDEDDASVRTDNGSMCSFHSGSSTATSATTSSRTKCQDDESVNFRLAKHGRVTRKNSHGNAQCQNQGREQEQGHVYVNKLRHSKGNGRQSCPTNEIQKDHHKYHHHYDHPSAEQQQQQPQQKNRNRRHSTTGHPKVDPDGRLASALLPKTQHNKTTTTKTTPSSSSSTVTTTASLSTDNDDSNNTFNARIPVSPKVPKTNAIPMAFFTMDRLDDHTMHRSKESTCPPTNKSSDDCYIQEKKLSNPKKKKKTKKGNIDNGNSGTDKSSIKSSKIKRREEKLKRKSCKSPPSLEEQQQQQQQATPGSPDPSNKKSSTTPIMTSSNENNSNYFTLEIPNCTTNSPMKQTNAENKEEEVQQRAFVEKLMKLGLGSNNNSSNKVNRCDSFNNNDGNSVSSSKSHFSHFSQASKMSRSNAPSVASGVASSNAKNIVSQTIHMISPKSFSRPKMKILKRHFGRKGGHNGSGVGVGVVSGESSGEGGGVECNGGSENGDKDWTRSSSSTSEKKTEDMDDSPTCVGGLDKGEMPKFPNLPFGQGPSHEYQHHRRPQSSSSSTSLYSRKSSDGILYEQKKKEKYSHPTRSSDASIGSGRPPINERRRSTGVTATSHKYRDAMTTYKKGKGIPNSNEINHSESTNKISTNTISSKKANASTSINTSKFSKDTVEPAFAAKVFDFPWTEGTQKGWYFGPIDSKFLPNGVGDFISAEDNSKTRGVWAHGNLVSVMVEDENSPTRHSGSTANTSTSAASANSNIKHRPLKSSKTSCSKKYSIGDVARFPGDMIIKRSEEDAIESVSQLEKFEQAFIKRSNGLWTFAILAERSFQPVNKNVSHPKQQLQNMKNISYKTLSWYQPHEINDDMELEERMLFVINADGGTKVIRKKHWGKYVRRLNGEAAK